MIKAHVFSKTQCPYCVKAKELLKQKNIEYEEAEVGVDVTKQDIQRMVDNMGVDVQIRTVPQIFFMENNHLKYIGGFTELDKYFREQ